MILVVIFSGSMLYSCQDKNQKPEGFSYIPASLSKVDFQNTIALTDSMNILNYIYFFNGGGVGLIDINNDGLEDIFFAGNQVPNRLYLNQGNMVFKDITEEAGLVNDRWCTGVSVVDINLDGYQDLYVAVTGLEDHNRENLLYINQGNNTFIENARAYGLNDNGFSTHSSFFDYDQDGDLDLYVLNHSNDREALNTPVSKQLDGQAANMDKLYRNNGNKTFTDVSTEAGIRIEGFGLGVSTVDINLDGWPDIYVSNDFLSNDILYINNQDGTFTNKIQASIKEQSYNGMGNDIADFNNDLLPDIAVLDMLPPSPIQEKTMAGGLTVDKIRAISAMEYEPQYLRNTLQVNKGNLKFDEIGRYAGIHRTDWSWSVLFADLDNSGWKDIHITNGYLKDITNKDYIDYNNNLSMFRDDEEARKGILKRVEVQPGIKPANFVLLNNEDLSFTDEGSALGMTEPSFSNGAAYGDLDLDGDLDLVVNNINQEAFIIRNDIGNGNNYIQFELQGPEENPNSIGAKVYLYAAGHQQLVENQNSRGFMSSVSRIIHFGLGSKTRVDSVVIDWNKNFSTRIENPVANQKHQVSFHTAEKRSSSLKAKDDFTDLSLPEYEFSYNPRPDYFNDFKANPLLPHRLNVDHPILVGGDVNGDGLEDLLVGGNEDVTLYLQKMAGGFDKVTLLSSGTALTDAAIVDMNNDRLVDVVLLITTAEGNSKIEVVLNSANTTFSFSRKLSIDIESGASFFSEGDYNQDGYTDLFVGGNTTAYDYPYASASYVVENQAGVFFSLQKLDFKGMVTDAAWLEFDQDQDMDLVVVGEWMPITFLENQKGYFENNTTGMGFEATTGWWNAIKAGDFDQDGDIDLICGNLGKNSPFSFSADQPLKIHQLKLSNSSSPMQVMTHYVNGQEVLYPSREALVRRNPFLSRLFVNHQSYAETDIETIAEQADLEEVPFLASNMMESVILLNDQGAFKMHELPKEFQLFPVYEILPTSKGIVMAGGFDLATYNGESFGSGSAHILEIVQESGGAIELKSTPISIRENVRSLVDLKIKNGQTLLISGEASGGIKIYDF